MLDLDLRDRVALVTGAARGIGRAIAARLVAEGARTVLVDLDPGVKHAAASLSGTIAVVADLTAPGEPDRIVAHGVEACGGLDVLVNNAGVSEPAAIEQLEPESWRRVMAVNLDAAYALSRAAYPHLAERRGSIVNIASFAGKRGTLFGDNASYTTSKAGIIGLTRALAIEGASRGVRVNAVAPGPVATELMSALSDEQRDRVTSFIPLGRLAQPDEIADLVAYLAAPRAAYITGEVVNINGGLVMD